MCSQTPGYLWAGGAWSLGEVGLPVGLVGDGQVGQTGAVVIHDVAGAVCWTHDLQETKQHL